MTGGAAPAAGPAPSVHELAYAKLNLVLHVGRPRADGLHPLCSLFASIDLADDLTAEPAPGAPGAAAGDSVDCAGVEGPNLVGAALAAFRERAPGKLPPLHVHVTKRIPVAAGLAGGSADAAAALRAANRLVGTPLDLAALHELARGLGSDVPSQIEPRHALVQRVGEQVDAIALPAATAVLVPSADGLSAKAVYAELDRRDGWRDDLDPAPLRRLAASATAAELAAGVENDLQPAALALRPELHAVLTSLRDGGALAAAVSGSGPTCFGLFADRAAADRAARGIPGGLVAALRPA